MDLSANITESTGNVFADLGFEPAEAVILEMRARLSVVPAFQRGRQREVLRRLCHRRS